MRTVGRIAFLLAAAAFAGRLTVLACADPAQPLTSLLARASVWDLVQGATLLALAAASWFPSAVFSALGREGEPAWRATPLRTGLCVLAVAGASLAASGLVGRAVGKGPPAYHDEYSYLFQARTILHGRWAFSSPPLPRLFDQVHVLNEGRFASRYFPGNGLWLAPFVALGRAEWGPAAAGMLAAVCTFFAARELMAGRGIRGSRWLAPGDTAGMIAGSALAVSPAAAIFENQLLAHAPTLLGLSLFLAGMLRGRRLASPAWWFVSGAGLAFAAICRPLTAASFALPFGAAALAWRRGGIRPTSDEGAPAGARSRRTICLLAHAVPLAAGLVLAADCNRAVTGRWFRSPYQEYTSRHTPRHVYGFYNVSRGAALQGDRVLRPFTARYDAWAEELTPARAAATAARRLAASAHWTVGPAAALAAWFCAPWLFAAGPRRTDALLVAGAAACLHLAHVPYWYAGIMNFHYVFESVLAYAVLLGCGLALWAERTEPPARPLRRFVRSAAPLAVWLAGVGQGWTDLGGEIANLRFARERYERFEREVVDRAARPALVLVRPDPSDLHIDYVTNPPDLAADVLRGRFDAAAPPLDEIRAAFPARRLYWFDARSFRFRPIEPSEPDPRSTAPGGPAQ